MRRQSGPPSRSSSKSRRPQAGGRSSAGRPAGGRGPAPKPGSSRGDFINIPKGGRLIMGDHAIREAFAADVAELETLILIDNWRDNETLREIEELARKKRLRMETRTAVAMDRLGSHQGALVIAKDQPSIELEDLLKLESATIVALDGVEDPHNLGAVLRTSWLMGVNAVLIPEDRAVGLTPVAHKVAAGGAEYVPVLRDNNFASVFAQLKEAGFWIFGLSHRAKSEIYELDIPKKVVWVMGAEDKGLRSSTERACDELIRIPQIEASASYNVSVATAMILSEGYRQAKVQATVSPEK